MTPLLFAARSLARCGVREVIAGRRHADANDTLPDGMSALILAAHSAAMGPMVGLLLLEEGANPNASEIGYTALHAAVLRDDLKLVQALLARKADPNAKLTKGTPIRRSNTDFNLPNPLIGATPYLLAAKFAEAEIMRTLAAGGADVKATLPNGSTALMLAAGLGSARNRRAVPIVEPESHILKGIEAAVGSGADVNEVNAAGDTALHLAAGAGQDTIVQFLVDHGAGVNVKNKRGQTPLTLALTAGGRRAAAAAADADIVGVPVAAGTHKSTADLLRKLGATQ